MKENENNSPPDYISNTVHASYNIVGLQENNQHDNDISQAVIYTNDMREL